MGKSLHTKYRPKTLDKVIGQSNVVAALERAAKRDNARAYLFHGPSGVGKTTLARIMARKLGVSTSGLIEMDAASKSGVDDVRKIKEIGSYKSFGTGGKRAVILDEAHRLSGNAWDALLKDLEEPAEHMTWFLCTTNVSKVPTTIRTRCLKFELKEVNDDDLGELLGAVCEDEGVDPPEDVEQLIIREAHGSPRQLLMNLEACVGAKTKREAADILKTAIETDTTFKLCRLLTQGGSWTAAMALAEKLKDDNAEGVRIIVCNYTAKCLLGAKNDGQAVRFLHVLDMFSTSYNPAEKMAPLLLSIGRVLFSNDQ